jgi:3-dehydroquinate synthase
MKIARPRFVRSTSALCKLLAKQLQGRRYILLTDENVAEACMPMLGDFLAHHAPLDVIEVEAGELCKSSEVCMQLWSHFLELEVAKSDVLVCLGGGSVTDLGGFVAATFKRGIPVIFIPTTLLAMTDAAIGGKNGIDFEEIKNAIGVISQPEAVIVFPDFCDTLSSRQWFSGMAEVVKHGVIARGDFWNELKEVSFESHKLSLKLLQRSALVKHAIVRQDPFENSRRMELNFGHTIGHAIESAYMQKGNLIEHGLAVVMGMIVELRLAVNVKFLSPNEADEITVLLYSWFGNLLPTFPQFDEIRSFLHHDKKVATKKNVLFLPSSSGEMKKLVLASQGELEIAYNQSIKA